MPYLFILIRICDNIVAQRVEYLMVPTPLNVDPKSSNIGLRLLLSNRFTSRAPAR
jgi:hypothetical protein